MIEMDPFITHVNDNFTDTYGRWFSDEGKRLKAVTFIVTHQCNLRCTYCYEHNKSDAEMDFETGKKCIDLLFEMDKTNHPYINNVDTHGICLEFIGGEPLLKIDLIKQLTDYFKDKAIRLNHRWATQYMISMCSNGLLYRDPKVQSFLNENDGRVSLTITIDGDKETHDRCRLDCNGCGSYDRAADAFASILAKYGQDGSKFTIAPANVDRTFEASKDIIEKFNLKLFHSNCVYEEGWDNEHAAELYRQLKQFAKWMIDTKRYTDTYVSIFDPSAGQPLPETHTENWCGGTGSMLAFDVDGTCYPCLRYAPLSIGNRPPYRIGDLEHGIGVLPEDKSRIDTLNTITRQSQSSEECINCPIASSCGWCSAYNYEATGSPNKRVTYICPTHKARICATAFYFNTIYKLHGMPDRFSFNVPKEWAIPIIGEEEYDMLVKLSSPDE